MPVFLRTAAAAFVLGSMVACGALAADQPGSAVASDANQAGSPADEIPPSPPLIQDGHFVLATDQMPVAD